MTDEQDPALYYAWRGMTPADEKLPPIVKERFEWAFDPTPIRAAIREANGLNEDNGTTG